MEVFAYVTFALVGVGTILTLWGGTLLLLNRMNLVRTQGTLPLAWSMMIAYVLTSKKYVWLFIISSVGYALLYAFSTGMIVYRPEVNFSEAYLARIPSVRMAVAYGPPGQIPIMVVYLTEHLGLLLVPLSIVLLVAVSVLVGLNIALAHFAYANRPRGQKGPWFISLWGVVGLFTGCPTCAGLFFVSFLGGAGATATASLLASYQILFIALAIQALALAPMLTSRNLSKTFREGCVVRGAGTDINQSV